MTEALIITLMGIALAVIGFMTLRNLLKWPMKKSLILTIVFFIILSISVNSQNNNNNGLPTRIEYVENVNKVNKITNQPKLDVHGTEYTYFENAKTFIQLIEGNSAVNNATCFLTMYYPNMSYKFIDITMQKSNDLNGIYFYDFTTENISGVYPLNVECFYVTSSDFKFPINSAIIEGELDSGALTDVYTDNDVYLAIGDIVAAQDKLSVIFNYTNVLYPNGTNKSDIMSIIWNGFVNTDPNDLTNINFLIYNVTSLSYQSLSNVGILTDLNVFTITNNAATSNDFKFGNNSISIKVIAESQNNATDNLLSFNTDFMILDLVQFVETQVENIKGSGEVHITRYLYDLTSSISNLNTNNITIELAQTNQNINTTRTQLLTSIYNSNNSIHAKLDTINFSIISNLFNVSGNLSLTIEHIITQSQTETPFELTLNECPLNTQTGSIAIAVLFMLLFFFAFFSWRAMLWDTMAFSGIGILTLSLFIFRCNAIIGGSIFAAAILIMYNAVRLKQWFPLVNVYWLTEAT